MRAVKYFKATSWSQAAEALKKDPNAYPIAGGSDILGWVKEGIEGKSAPPAQAFVDIRSITRSDKISYSKSDGLKTAALATLSSVETTKEVMENFPILAKAAAAAASPNIRATG